MAFHSSLNLKLICLIGAICGMFAAAACAEPAENHPPENRGATYTNPIIANPPMADPDVLQVGKTYYMYTTSHTKGYDVYVSLDLVHWKNQGLVFDDPRGGAWAPDLFHSRRGDKHFYLYYTDDRPNPADDHSQGPVKQIGVAVADSPLGPFVDQGALATDAIDAHLFEDDDGRQYLYYVILTDGFKIVVQPMQDPLTPNGQPSEVLRPIEPWEQVSGRVTEGPFMLKRGDTYYLMYSGTSADSPNYAIGYATAKSPLGPFTKFAGNPIAHRTETVLGPGHHSVVEGPHGGLWMLYHQKTDDQTNYRRVIALDPLWYDDQGVLHAKVTKGTAKKSP